MAFRQPSPDFGAAARNPDQLENVLRDFHQRFQKVEKRTSTEAVSSRNRAPVAAKPPRAGITFKGTAGKGQWFLSLRNPEFGNTAGTGKQTPTPLYHRVSWSADPNFRTGVTTLDPSPQTHFSIVDEPNQILFVRVQSSRDGVTWNLPQDAQAKG